MIAKIPAAVGRDRKTVTRIMQRAAERAAGTEPPAVDKATAGLKAAKRILGGLPELLGDGVVDEVGRLLAAIELKLTR